MGSAYWRHRGRRKARASKRVRFERWARIVEGLERISHAFDGVEREVVRMKHHARCERELDRLARRWGRRSKK